MKHSSEQSDLDRIATHLAPIAYLTGAICAFAYCILGSFADPTCGHPDLLTGRIVSVTNDNGSVTLKLDGVPAVIRYAAPGTDRSAITKTLDAAKGQVASVVYRKGKKCSGGEAEGGKRVFPSAIYINETLVLTEHEVQNAVDRERMMLIIGGTVCLGMALYFRVARRPVHAPPMP